MKKIKLLTALLFTSLIVNAQSISVYDVKKSDNIFIYNDNYVKVFVDDNVKIQATIVQDTLKNLTLVQKPSSNTLIITVGKENYTGGKGVMLKITNPFNKKLKFKAEVKVKDGKEYENFSIKVIPALTTTKEIWTGDVESIVLSDFVIE